MHCKLSVILALAVLRIAVMLFFISLGIIGTLDRFPSGDRMKALPFLGMFMFALRWHQADSVVRLVPGELVFKSGTICFGYTSGQGERFKYLRQN